MPNIDLSILNQRQTPAFYADVLANRPAAGFIGRIFVSTNTYEFYRDNGTGWDLIGGPGTGTVTGGGSLYRVGIWTSTSNIGESADLVFDYSQGHLGINTTTPGTALDVHHNQNTILQLNQTTGSNDTRIAFQNNGVALWRIGNFYNGTANDFGIFDVVGAQASVTVKRTTGQVLIGTSTVGSGKLVVASATGDNGVQIVGASAPSLRIDNAESGPTKRAGFGISTATNNFIQGSADRDFCMFNGSTTASPILFGIYDTTNVQEAARISAARNFLVGKTTDSGQKFQVSGTSFFSSNVGIGVAPNPWLVSNGLDIFNGGSLFSFTNNAGLASNGYFDGTNWRYINSGVVSTKYETSAGGVGRHAWFNAIAGTAGGVITYTQAMTLFSTGNLAINTTTDAGYRLDVNGTARVSNALTLNGAYTNSSDVSLIISASLPGINLRAGSNGRFSIITNFASGNTTSFAVATGTNNPTQCVLIDHATNLVTFSGAINISNTVAAAVAAPSTHKVSILIGGVQYYLLASNV